MSMIAMGRGTSGYTFKKLPETEALADALNYVCETNNTSPGGNETGVGGGQTGVDLVLTQGGSIPGSVGGWRTITDRSSMYLSPTAAMLNAFLRNSIGFSSLMKLRNINTTGSSTSGVFLNYIEDDTYTHFGYGFQRTAGAYVVMGYVSSDGASGNGVLPNAGQKDFAAGTGIPVYLLTSVDYVNGIIFSGLSYNKQPGSLADCVVYNISQPKTTIGVPPAMTFNTFKYVIGCGTSYLSNGCDIASVTFSKYPSVSFG